MTSNKPRTTERQHLAADWQSIAEVASIILIRLAEFPFAKNERECGCAFAVAPQPPTAREIAMGTREDYAYGSSDYLKAEKLAGKSTRVIISDVEDVEFDKGLKPVLSFEGKEKRLVVNATNFDVLCDGISNNTKD